MKDATIFRVRSEDKFCRIPNETLQDEKLSFKAKGILAYLLSKPDGWKPRVTDMANHGTDGRAAIISGLVELRGQNYAELQKLYRGGKVVEWRLLVADSKMFKTAGEVAVIHIDKLETENLVLGFPLMENLVVENRGHSNTVLVERKSDSKIETSAGAVSDDGKTKITAEEIYKAYPLHVGKPVALRAIEKAAANGTPRETLLAKAKEFAAVRGGDLAYCPHPATWFNAERFNDSPETWKPKPSNTKPADFTKPGKSPDTLKIHNLVLTRETPPRREQFMAGAEGQSAFETYYAAWRTHFKVTT